MLLLFESSVYYSSEEKQLRLLQLNRRNLSPLADIEDDKDEIEENEILLEDAS